MDKVRMTSRLVKDYTKLEPGEVCEVISVKHPDNDPAEPFVDMLVKQEIFQLYEPVPEPVKRVMALAILSGYENLLYGEEYDDMTWMSRHTVHLDAQTPCELSGTCYTVCSAYGGDNSTFELVYCTADPAWKLHWFEDDSWHVLSEQQDAENQAYLMFFDGVSSRPVNEGDSLVLTSQHASEA